MPRKKAAVIEQPEQKTEEEKPLWDFFEIKIPARLLLTKERVKNPQWTEERVFRICIHCRHWERSGAWRRCECHCHEVNDHPE